MNIIQKLYVKNLEDENYMYVHIGNDELLKSEDIIAILDVETLRQSRNNLRIINLLKDQNSDVKSVVLIKKGEKIEERFSIISTTTIKSRIEQF